MSIESSRGVTLVELIVVMVVIGIALAMFASFNTIVAGSPNPEVRKQALAIAESLLEEVELMAFTYCDANDANAATATSASGCAVPSNSENILPPPAKNGETRYSTTFPFNNVADYNGFSMPAGICDITAGGPSPNNCSSPLTGLGAYTASVVVTQVNLASGGDQIASPEALNIAVTVTGPGNVSITLEGYRTRYAPNTTP